MADTPEGETVTPEALENKAEPKVTPPEEKQTEDSEVERLRKENEKILMERNQLRNKLDAEEKAKADAKAKQLEEQEQFKTLYEQEKSKREEIERERETEEQRKAVTEASQNVLADYPEEVKALAEDTGLSLTDVTDDAVAEFKAKLDKIQTRVASKVTPNNPAAVSGKKEYSRDELRAILNDPVKRDEYYRQKNGVTAMMMEPRT